MNTRRKPVTGFRWSMLLLGCIALPVAAQQAKPNAKQQVMPQQDAAAQAFKVWDKDGNGNLSLVEFRNGWQQVQRVAEAQGRLRQQFGRVDANDDGGIDASEYAQLQLVKQAGRQAPPLARFDANASGKLEFGEYLQLVQAMAPRPAAKGSNK